MAEASPLNIVFMGTPEFAAVILRQLVGWDGCRVIGAYCQPDRPCGRGQQCRPPAVKMVALEHSIPVFQPLNFKTAEAVDELRALKPDVLVVAAYGLILPQVVLDVAPHGAINVHGSLLPKHRGAAPIQRAIMEGDKFTGITIMQMELALDSGPMLLQRALGIGVDDTAGTMHDQLAELGGRLLIDALARVAAGTIVPIPQEHDRATYAAKLTKDDGRIDFSRTAEEVHAHVRGVTPWPGAHFQLALEGREPMQVSIEPGTIGPLLEAPTPPGTLVGLAGDCLSFACADRYYLVRSIRPANRKALDARGFACGYMRTDCECPGVVLTECS